MSIRIFPGSELHLVPELVDQIKIGHAMTFADRGKAVLVELPKHMVPIGASSILQNILYMGITPVIAHPERNTALRRDSKVLEQWISWGCKVQLTAQSCAGDFGSEIEKVCKAWCKRGWVHIIASDAHRPSGRSPYMKAGINRVTKWIGREAATGAVLLNPQHLLNGEPLENISVSKSRMRIGWRWL
ncbi:MAG: hypothetical protein GKR95_24080 [Gammaproteobacteria bacterium]|nr:hypothetical protein [Gammaproteobacteria bacterium]